MLFAAIYVPDFPVEAVVRAEPELRERAVVVVEGPPPLLRVLAGNERARAAGIEPGMTKLEAEGRLAAAAQSGPFAGGGELRRRSLAQEAAAHAALLDCACAFSPRVEDNPSTPDTVVLDLDGLERLFGPPPKLARDLARRAAELGLETHVAVAANLETAIHAARGFAGITIIPPGEEANRLGALPLELLLDSAVRDRKRALEMQDTLARWGIRTFRALAALPDSAVRQRLGETGVALQKLARGEGARPLIPADPPLVFEEAVELEYPVALLEPLSGLLARMLEQLCVRLETRALATQEVRLRLNFDLRILNFDLGASPDDVGQQESYSPRRHGDTEENFDLRILNFDSETAPGSVGRQELFPPQRNRKENPKPPIAPANAKRMEVTQSKFKIQNSQLNYVLRLPVPMVDAKVFLKLLQLDLQGRPPAAPVEKMWLRAEPIRPRFTQGGLFLPAAPEPEKLEVLLARIGSIVSSFKFSVSRRRASDASTGNWKPETGNALVGSPELLDTHQPDAFRMKRFSPGIGPSKAADGEPLPGPESARNSQLTTHNSLRRFRPPRSVRVRVCEGRPEAVYDFRLAIFDSGGVPDSVGQHDMELQKSHSPRRHGDTEGSFDLRMLNFDLDPAAANGVGRPRFDSTRRHGDTEKNPDLRTAPENAKGMGAAKSKFTIHNSQSERSSQIANVLWSSGPWRESGEWWSGAPWSREVWDVALQAGEATAVYRIFRDLLRNQWFVEAEYD